MEISLKEIFLHRQCVNFPVSCYFDRKTYTFIRKENLPQDKEPYTRYIPLIQVDQEELESKFLMDLNNQRIINKWRDFEFCFEEYCQRNQLWNRWWDYYTNAVDQMAVAWCESHKIKYRGESDIENQ